MTPMQCPPPDPAPRTPRLKVPAGATDTHFHIFGPEQRYPYVAERRFTPPEASVASYTRVHRTLGLSRAVLVQPSGYGVDNRRQLEAADEFDFPTRVVVVLPPDVSDRELDRLHAQGARGLRFIPTQPGGLPLSNLELFADRLAERGWHIQMMIAPEHLTDLSDRFTRLKCPVVIDHMADVPAEGGVSNPAFCRLERLLKEGNCWVKLSAGYHASTQEPPYPELIARAHALMAASPDRLLWGSDWPHANHYGNMPNTTDLLDLLLEWIPDDNVRDKILVDNPAHLYGFE